MVFDAEPSNYAAFPLPPATPVASTYPCELGSQHAKNNFKPRTFRRIPSGLESQAALRRALQKYWGHADFRGPQLDICTHALRGCDVMVVAPTGLGKSVCFQVPAVTIEYGVTIVVSPLLALMRDQVSGLQAKGIKAYQLSEKTDFAEIREIKRQLRLGHPQLRLLYITPETLFSPKYQAEFDIAYRQKQIVRLVVDEAHVIDEWGSTFRPTYRRLGEFRQRYPTVPITALTASATSEVRNDLLTILNMPKTSEQGLAQWVEPFNRKNLFYEVRHQGGYDRNSETIQDLVGFVKKFIPEATAIHERHGVKMPCISGLVYCRLTADCETIAAVLNENGISARPFYAKLPESKRHEALDDWKAGRVECIVATIAFGMGVDQAHVRYVVHYDMPKSFEGYYQETGRAGRDGHMSRCVLYYSREDALRLRGLISKEADRSKKDGNDQATIERGKLRMINSFKALQLLAESTALCRHINICRYFGEKIESTTADILEKYCNGMCDICVNKAGVFTRSFKLNEEAEVASPIIHPLPLEEAPDYLTLSSQAGQCSLAAFHDTPAPQLSVRASNFATFESSHEPIADVVSPSFPAAGPSTPFRTPRLPPLIGRPATREDLITPVPPQLSSLSRAALTPLAPNSPSVWTPRAQTMDQLADEGLSGGVVIIGEERSPDHAEKKRKAMAQAFKGVTAATPGGPFSFYNVASGTQPRKKARVASSFKVPSFQSAVTPFQSTATPFQPTVPPRRPAESTQDTSDDMDRASGLRKLQEALMTSLFEGDLAERVLQHWGRKESGEVRRKLLRKIARELELDMAKISRSGEPYGAVVKDTCSALKLIRDSRGVALVTGDKLVGSQDPRVERLRHIEICFRTVRLKN